MATCLENSDMSLLVLSLAIIFPIPVCLLRRKKYNISLLQMFIIYVVFSVVGAIGARMGSYAAGASMFSVRLYGLIIFDSIALLLLSRIMKIDIGKMGDFIAAPIMVSCSSAKIGCLINGCCYGFVILETQSGVLDRFPSALFEMLLWAIIAEFLIIIEKNGDSKNNLWAIMVIWFGFFRFLASFFRGNEKEFVQILPGITGAQFWSFVAFLIGVLYLYLSLKRNLNRNPKVSEILKAAIGRGVLNNKI